MWRGTFRHFFISRRQCIGLDSQQVDMQDPAVAVVPLAVALAVADEGGPSVPTETAVDAAADATGGKKLINSQAAAMIVRDFVLLKAFDVVSSGQYRKFVLRKKDLCDQWAMTMHDNYHMMMLEVRSLSKYTVMARSQGHMEVAMVCNKLLHCMECPHVESSGWNTCSITKVQCVGGVRVNSASETTAIIVHPRFLRFCLSFWYTSRFEHVLRRVVRGKYTKIYCDQYTLSQVSARIHADTEIVEGVVGSFIHALAHVHRTMHTLIAIPTRGSETLSNFAIYVTIQNGRGGRRARGLLKEGTHQAERIEEPEKNGYAILLTPGGYRRRPRYELEHDCDA